MHIFDNAGNFIFVSQYFNRKKEVSIIWSWLKTIFVCIVTFFGAMFSIMTFQTDVDIPNLFQNVYFWLTGTESSGFTILEISYAIGIGAGAIFFFNHFGKWKFNQEPTPIEVEMADYEDQVQNATKKMEQNEL